MWERGLKQWIATNTYNGVPVAPHVGAWIETLLRAPRKFTLCGSLPMWERGLKPECRMSDAAFVSRSPCGSVD